MGNKNFINQKAQKYWEKNKTIAFYESQNEISERQFLVWYALFIFNEINASFFPKNVIKIDVANKKYYLKCTVD